MKTATYKMLSLFVLLFATTTLLAQEEKNDLQSTTPVDNDLNADQNSKSIDPGTSDIVTFTVFPNPANTVLYARMGTDPATQSEIQIFNARWQQVYFSNVTGITDLTIDITGFAEGMYFVRLTSGYNQIAVKKVNILP